MGEVLLAEKTSVGIYIKKAITRDVAGPSDSSCYTAGATITRLLEGRRLVAQSLEITTLKITPPPHPPYMYNSVYGLLKTAR